MTTQGEKIFVAVLAIAAVWVGVDVLILAGVIPSFAGLGGGSGAASGPAAAILAAITKAENVASYHNNPGGICGGYDANGQCTGPKTFATIEEGTAAALALINKYLLTNPAITVAEFVQKWTGGATAGYKNTMNSELGLGPNDPIGNAGGDGGGDDGLDDGSGSSDDDGADF